MAAAAHGQPAAVLAAFAGMLLVGSGAPAEPVTLNGVTFSDELGGFAIVGGSGTGSLGDPFVVIERVTDPAGATLVIRNLDRAGANRVRTFHTVGFALTKVIVNGTDHPWSFFEMELQKTLGLHSDDSDGLSFGQGAKGLPFGSDAFATVDVMYNPYDEVTFDGGPGVRPGESGRFTVVITDNTPVPAIYLLQRFERPIASTVKPLAISGAP